MIPPLQILQLWTLTHMKMTRSIDIDDVDDIDTYDQYVGAQIRVPIGDKIRYGNVMRCNPSLGGTLKGRVNANAMLDTRTY
jgi:hypothetical protein